MHQPVETDSASPLETVVISGRTYLRAADVGVSFTLSDEALAEIQETKRRNAQAAHDARMDGTLLFD